MKWTPACRVLVALALLACSPAWAAQVTDVASAFDEGDPFDFNLKVGYEFLTKQASVKRERLGPGLDGILNVKDLRYVNRRHTMRLRTEFGLYKDLMVFFELPFIMSDSRELSYDQRLGSGCVFTGPGANCVNAGNSTTTNSAITQDNSDADQRHYIVPFGGHDARNQGVSFAPNSDLVFRGPQRGGGSGANPFDVFSLGATYALLSQERDDTKPTWILSFRYDISIGNVMKYDRTNPDANHGASDGLDHVYVSTAISHRFKYVDPYVLFFFDYPYVRRGDTLFVRYGDREKNSQPQMTAGTRFGFEAVPWENKKDSYKLLLDINARINAKFDGRGYSEIWEMLAGSPGLACEADPTHRNYNKACDTTLTDTGTGQPLVNPYQGQPFSGLSVIDNHMIYGIEAALGAQISKYLRFRANFLYLHEQGHIITADDVGKPDVPGGRVAAPQEFNPAFRPIINTPGRRYRVDNVDNFAAGIWLQGMF